jgi:hypothetical protein
MVPVYEASCIMFVFFNKRKAVETGTRKDILGESGAGHAKAKITRHC